MRIIIAGCGEMGFHLSKLLAKEEHDIVIIDKDPDVLAQADILDVISIVGSATSYKVLEQANIKSSDLLIAVTESEETNMISCTIGKHLGVKKTIARISNSDFIHRKDAFDLSSVGIDEVIFPEALAAKEIRKLLKESAAITTFDFEGGLLEFIGIPIGKDSALNGKSLKETNYLNPDNNFTPVAILRDVEDVVKNKTIIPRADDIFEASDHAYFVAERDGGVDRVLALSGKKQYDIKDLMIYGGGPMAFVTAKHLAKKYKIKLIEEDRARCEEIAAAIPNIMVLNGSGTDLEFLMKENLEYMDAFLSLTGETEKNILAALAAKETGIKKVIALVGNIEYIPLSQNMGVDTLINKKIIAADFISRHVKKGELLDLHSIHGLDADVIELKVNENSPICNKKIGDIEFPKTAVVGGVIRNNRSKTVRGDFVFENNDKVVVMCLQESKKIVQSLFR